ncbi:MAG: hypothetical protein KTR25_13100 [Myxococcales bacterium]|nr:hypothetical protein [Myxococcales bacterium]
MRVGLDQQAARGFGEKILKVVIDTIVLLSFARKFLYVYAHEYKLEMGTFR